MNWISLLGATAAICTTTAYVPQVLRAWRTRSTQDVSLKMYFIMCTGNVLWLLYGLGIGDWPLIGANFVSLTLTGTILALKVRYG